MDEKMSSTSCAFSSVINLIMYLASRITCYYQYLTLVSIIRFVCACFIILILGIVHQGSFLLYEVIGSRGQCCVSV
jgi:hypothetical protein